MELLIGCGHRREKFLGPSDKPDWTQLVTLDSNPDCKPDVLHDLNALPYPFEDNKFDEVHAYEVLEHCGTQGDFKFFFGQFNEFYRILKPNGLFCATVPAMGSRWVWGDPSHTRAIQEEQLWFLDRDFYNGLGGSASSDFLRYLKGSFKLMFKDYKEAGDDKSFIFILQAIKNGH